MRAWLVVFLACAVAGCEGLAGLSGPFTEPTPGNDAGVDSGSHPRDAGKDRDADAHEAGDDAKVADVEAGVGQPPSLIDAPADGQTEVNLAAHYIWMGDTNPTPAFTPDASAWASFGYNIDGLITTAASTDVCTPPRGDTSVQVDGVDGIDNSVGRNIIPTIVEGFGPVSLAVTSELEAGLFTTMLDTFGLTDDPDQTNSALSGSFLTGGQYPLDAGPPTFTLADDWPVDPDSLTAGTLASGAATSFTGAYITHGVWVSGKPLQSLVFTLPLDGLALNVNIHLAVVSFRDEIDDAGAHRAVSGVVSGVIYPRQLIATIAGFVANVDAGQCGEVDLLAPLINDSVDIYEDGSNGPGSPCDAISVALKFEADQIQPPNRVGRAPFRDAGTPPCPLVDAGQ